MSKSISKLYHNIKDVLLDGSATTNREKIDPLFLSPLIKLKKGSSNKRSKQKGFLFSDLDPWENQNSILNAFKNKDLKKMIKELLENLFFSLQNEEILLVFETLDILKDVFLCMGEISNALNSCYHLKLISEYTSNPCFVLRSLMGLNDCLKLLRKYDLCLKVLKKALEYSWFLNEDESQSQIYEKIGIVYFLLGDMNKSLFYHSRSISLELDEPTNIIKNYAIKKLKEKFHKKKKNHFQINNLFLKKLGVKMQYSEEATKKQKSNFFENVISEINSPISSETIHEKPLKLSFGTNVSIQDMIEKIFREEEFLNEIPSPRYYKSEKKNVIEIRKPKKNNYSEEKSFFLPLLQQNIKKTDYNKQLDPYIKKMTTNQMIRLREKNLFDLKSKKKLETEPSLVALQNTKFYYNDLTPNRNVNGFNVYNLLSQKKLKLYCEKFTHHDRNISMSYQDKSFQFYKKTIKTSLKEEIE